MSQGVLNRDASAAVYGNGMVSQGGAAATARQYYLDDGLGNVRYVTSNTGSSVQTYAYDPYGNQVTGSTTLSSFAYQEQQTDYENGLQYLRARYYDTKNGRFLSRDPVAGTLATPASQNGYNYAHANPINLSDPSGEFVPLLIGGALLVWSAYDVSQGVLNCDAGAVAGGAIGLLPFGRVVRVAGKGG